MTGNATKNHDQTAGDSAGDVLVTIPNIICAVRIGGALGLFALALSEQPRWLLILFLVLTATDWIDGKLAIWLDQRSTFGARLDSVADGVMYAGILFGGIWLKGDVLGAEWPWIAVALLTYVISCLLAVFKYGRLPSYHTRTAKVAWGFMVVAVFALFFSWSVWPLRLAAVAVSLANIDSIIITLLLPHWQANVRSCFDASRSEPQ